MPHRRGCRTCSGRQHKENPSQRTQEERSDAERLLRKAALRAIHAAARPPVPAQQPPPRFSVPQRSCMLDERRAVGGGCMQSRVRIGASRSWIERRRTHKRLGIGRAFVSAPSLDPCRRPTAAAMRSSKPARRARRPVFVIFVTTLRGLRSSATLGCSALSTIGLSAALVLLLRGFDHGQKRARGVRALAAFAIDQPHLPSQPHFRHGQRDQLAA